MIGYAPTVTVLVETVLLHASGMRSSFVLLCRTFAFGHGVHPWGALLYDVMNIQ
jgi:hypothetical protein